MAEAVVEIVPLSFGTIHSRLFSFKPVCGDILIMLDANNFVEVYMCVRFFNSQQVLRLLLTCEGIHRVSKHKDSTIILRKWQRR